MRARVLRWSASLGGDPAAAQAAGDAAAMLMAAQHEGHVCIRINAATRRALPASKVVALADRVGDLDADLPFVLDAAGRLYLQRVFDDERAVARRLVAAERNAAKPTAVVLASNTGTQAPSAAPRHGTTSGDITAGDAAPDRQAQAVALGITAPVLVISGGPGTGKTTTLARIIDVISRQSPDTRIALAAPTGKAAARVTQALAAARAANPNAKATKAAPLRARTVHAWLGVHPHTGRPRHDPHHPLPVDLVVVDEASMLDLELARALLDALPAHARLILLGDKDQLAAVQAGAVFAELASDDAHVTADDVDADADQRRVPAVVQLVHGWRFGAGSAIARLARSVRDGDADAAIDLLREGSRSGGEIVWRDADVDARVELAPGLHPYLEALDALAATVDEETDDAIVACLDALDAWRVLCAVHDGPSGTRTWNRRACTLVQRAFAAHAVGRSAEGTTRATGDAWFAGRAILVTRNDATLGLVNGDVGIVLPAPMPARGSRAAAEPTLRHAAFLRADGRVVRWPVARLPPLETAFATSVHKAQGSEFDRVTLVLPTPWQRPCTRELVYTAITRARGHVTVIADETSLRASIAMRTQRLGGLADRLREARLAQKPRSP